MSIPARLQEFLHNQGGRGASRATTENVRDNLDMGNFPCNQ